MTPAPNLRSRRPGVCTYCLTPVDDLTDDHVFPDSWYAADTPANMAKPQVPACKSCNNERYSKIENTVREAFVLSFADGDPRVAGIQAAALRGINPDSTDDPVEKRIRANRREALLRRIAGLSGPAEPPTNATMVPGLGPTDPGANQQDIRVGVNAGDFHDLLEKIVRGMTFIETGRLIGPEYVIETWLATEAVHDGFTERAITPVTSRFGPSFEFTSTRETEKDPIGGAIIFTIWGVIRIAASVLPREPGA